MVVMVVGWRNWPDIVKKLSKKLDYPETGIVHFCPQTKKIVCDDCTFKYPHYASWKTYEDAMKSSLISLRKAWLNWQLTRRVPHAPSTCATTQSTKTRLLYDCSAQEEAPTLKDCLEPGLLLQDNV